MATYAVSDFHGCLAAYKLIKRYLKPEDIVICLGDCGDRGPDGWEVIKTVYADPQFIYLKGNHEDMLAKAMKEYNKFHVAGHDTRLCYSNGGESTFVKWIEDGADNVWPHRLQKLPLMYTYTNINGATILLNHSGYNENGEEEDLLWDRDTLFYYDSDYDYIVHGHTPIPYLEAEYKNLSYFCKDKEEYQQVWNEQDAFQYCNNRKFDIDAGTFFTNKTILFNLDTFESISFDIRDYE